MPKKTVVPSKHDLTWPITISDTNTINQNKFHANPCTRVCYTKKQTFDLKI